MSLPDIYFYDFSRQITQLEIKSGNPLKISGKGGTSGKLRRKKS
jgi:hypothetical protein